MKSPRPSIESVADENGEWVVNKNIIKNERVLNPETLPFFIKTDSDLDKLPNGFTGFIYFDGHPVYNSFGTVMAHVVSGGTFIGSRTINCRVINIQSYNENGDIQIHGSLIRVKKGTLSSRTNYKFIDNETRYALNSTFKVQEEIGVYSAIDLPNGKRLLSGESIFQCVDGLCEFTLPLPFKDTNYTLVINDQWDGVYVAASTPKTPEIVSIWVREFNDHTGVYGKLRTGGFAGRYFGIGNR